MYGVSIVVISPSKAVHLGLEVYTNESKHNQTVYAYGHCCCCDRNQFVLMVILVVVISMVVVLILMLPVALMESIAVPQAIHVTQLVVFVLRETP